MKLFQNGRASFSTVITANLVEIMNSPLYLLEEMWCLDELSQQTLLSSRYMCMATWISMDVIQWAHTVNTVLCSFPNCSLLSIANRIWLFHTLCDWSEVWLSCRFRNFSLRTSRYKKFPHPWMPVISAEFQANVAVWGNKRIIAEFSYVFFLVPLKWVLLRITSIVKLASGHRDLFIGLIRGRSGSAG